ncbi:hypothetical protein OCU04_010087 [Sclerotinia nivalis]|uniref:Uncharacterized protein n=1 Tax=Sclerotinia nivalis TaxID=352851 RepID=A0A9X0DFJ8_9HELO|nr:hypothetical protein OCU04_010087 [Sclerotinia nivalis]
MQTALHEGVGCSIPNHYKRDTPQQTSLLVVNGFQVRCTSITSIGANLSSPNEGIPASNDASNIADLSSPALVPEAMPELHSRLLPQYPTPEISIPTQLL